MTKKQNEITLSEFINFLLRIEKVGKENSREDYCVVINNTSLFNLDDEIIINDNDKEVKLSDVL